MFPLFSKWATDPEMGCMLTPIAGAVPRSLEFVDKRRGGGRVLSTALTISGRADARVRYATDHFRSIKSAKRVDAIDDHVYFSANGHEYNAEQQPR